MEYETESVQDRVRPASIGKPRPAHVGDHQWPAGGERPRPASEEERRQAREAIRALAHPRMTGSPEASRVDQELRRRFEALGYQIHEVPFHFSALPGRFGIPLAGALTLIGGIASTWLILYERGGAALATLLGIAGALSAMARLSRRAVTRLPWDRRVGVNWLVKRPGARPSFVVVAHRDTKSQPVSTYLRIAAAGLTVVGWGALLILAAGAIAGIGPRFVPLVAGAGAITAAGSVTLLFCRADNRSPGALDNASGLAALLALARREREHDDIAFIVTDAEELGLVGATDVARKIPPVIGVINLDGLDDDGPVHIIERFGLPRRGIAPHLAAAHLQAAAALDIPARRRDLPLGIGVDHIAFTRAGHPALTLMRGTPKSLRRVHRPEDTPERLSGAGAAEVAAIVSGALDGLRGQVSGVGRRASGG